ncbi:MAG: hypothetical protein CMJ20_12705 [Phycisphaeraceae bacterium]|nr:hypothetical protein [Phycisphaeraceae bacterium]
MQSIGRTRSAFQLRNLAFSSNNVRLWPTLTDSAICNRNKKTPKLGFVIFGLTVKMPITFHDDPVV